MTRNALRSMLIAWLAGAAAVVPSAALAQPSEEVQIPSLVDQARTVNLAHARAADLCDLPEWALQRRLIEAIERESGEALQRVRAAERAVGRGENSPAVQQAIADFVEIGRIRDVIIHREADCDRRYRLGLRVGGAYGHTYVPRVGIGFLGQQQENHAARSSRTVDMRWLTSSLDTRIGTVPFSAWGEYGWGNRSTTFDLPATNQTQFGAIYTAPSPSGSSGVQLQLFGISGQTTVRVRNARLGIDIPLKVAENESPRPTNRVFFAYSYFDRMERTYTGRLGFETAFLNNTLFMEQERRQKLDENVFAAGLGGEIEMSPARQWIFEVAARAGFHYRRSSLESVEQVRSNVVPLADQNFTTVVEDRDGGAGFDGEARAAMSAFLYRNVALTVEGTAGYRSDVGAIFNPSSSQQLLNQGLGTQLDSDDLWWWRVGAGVTFRFGASETR